MPIRWSALKVSDAVAMIEEYVNQAAEPLEQARIVAEEAREMPHLPQYVDAGFARILDGIGLAIGGSRWHPTGRIQSGIQSVRESLPAGAVEKERKQPSLLI